MNQLHNHPILATPTGTSATALLHKGLRPITAGTCSALQLEQSVFDNLAPERKVEQELKWNGTNPCCKGVSAVCSGVPVATQISIECLPTQIARRPQ
jgi:hypothetical protein